MLQYNTPRIREHCRHNCTYAVEATGVPGNRTELREHPQDGVHQIVVRHLLLHLAPPLLSAAYSHLLRSREGRRHLGWACAPPAAHEMLGRVLVRMCGWTYGLASLFEWLTAA